MLCPRVHVGQVAGCPVASCTAARHGLGRVSIHIGLAAHSDWLVHVFSCLERVGFDRIDVFTRQVEAAFVKHNAFNLSGEFNLTRHALIRPVSDLNSGAGLFFEVVAE